MKRHVEPEIIDDPSTSREEVEYVLSCVRTTNRRLGGIDLVLNLLRRWSARWPRDRAVTMLDIGTGAADIPLAAVQWARASGFDLRITAIDTNERVLSVAREWCRDEPAITFLHQDALELVDESRSPFDAEEFDYIHAGMFLHHLADDVVPRMLSAMDRVARAGIIWNDLIRSRRGYAVAWLVTLGRPIRHDCLASLRAGFKEEEVLAIAAAAGIDYAGYAERFRDQRFALAGEKPRAWTSQLPETAAPASSPGNVHAAASGAAYG